MSYAALARELGCEIRRFRSVQSAMRWYMRRHLDDLAIDLNRGPRIIATESDEDRDGATAVLIGKCLEQEDREVDAFRLHHVRVFAAWCCGLDNRETLAEEVGGTLSHLRRTMLWTEDVVGNRMRFRGLIE